MEILNVEQLTHEKWLNLFAATFAHDGHTGRWVFASRRRQPHHPGGGCDAVVIVPVLHAPGAPPRLVLVKEFRVPVGGYVIGFPAGLLEAGEGLEETVRRELLEETGLEIEPREFFGAWIDRYGDGPGTAFTLNLFWRATASGGEPRPADDVAEIRWVSAEELDSLDFAWEHDRELVRAALTRGSV